MQLRFPLKAVALCATLALSADLSMASPILNVSATLGPGFPGIAGFNAWQANVVTALENGKTTAGPAVDPNSTSGPDSSSFFPVNQVPMNYVFLGNAAVTAWYGFRPPESKFGPNFTNEEGNRLFYPVDIKGNGTKIDIAELTINISSTDTTGFRRLQNPNTLTTVYGPGAVGIIHGTGGDTFITSGPTNQLVDEIVYRGVGTSITPDQFSPSKNPNPPPGTPLPLVPDAVNSSNDAQANGALAYMKNLNPFTASVLYTLTIPEGNGTQMFTGTDSVNILAAVDQPVPISSLSSPEPATGLLMFSGVALFSTRRRLARR